MNSTRRLSQFQPLLLAERDERGVDWRSGKAKSEHAEEDGCQPLNTSFVLVENLLDHFVGDFSVMLLQCSP